MLPKGVKSISEVNINNHRKHCDPALIAEDYLKEAGIPTESGDTITKLYAMRYKEKLSKVDVLHEVYRERIKNMEFLQKLLNDRQAEYDAIPSNTSDTILKSKKNNIASTMKSLIKDIDNIQNSMQTVLVRDLGVENGAGTSTVNVYNNVVNVFQGSLKDFMNEMVPYLMLHTFAHDAEKGMEVVKEISAMMDRNLGPALGSVIDTAAHQPRQLKSSTGRAIN
jgi:molecular chaperone GrpE (heat shock protein)